MGIAELLAQAGSNPLTEWLNKFILTHAWISLVIPMYLLFLKYITGIRDILDKTPETDDNWFEKSVTFLKKFSGLVILGQRPKAPDTAKPAPGASADAIGVKVVDKK